MADTTGDTPDRLIDWASEPATRRKGPIITMAIEADIPMNGDELSRNPGAVVLVLLERPDDV